MPALFTDINLHSCLRKQRGAALMVMLVILVLGATAMLVSSLSSIGLRIERDKITADALAQTKDALIGRGIVDISSPGSLPCPDTNDDGSAESTVGQPNGNCPSYIGRLPWKTLGLPDLRDGSGERLWYALSPNFRDYVTLNPINSNSKGTLLVYRADGLSLQTETGYNAVAVIFSPGSPVGTQTRNTVAQQNDAANYLDSIVIPGPITRNNATVGGPFIAGTKSETFNDQLLFITTKDLMPLVEQRVAGVVKQALSDYYTANGYYPWADSVPQSADYDANYGLNRGWLPYHANATSGYPYYYSPNWVAGSPPQWFFDNQWYTLIYYSVAKNSTANSSYCYYYGSCSGSSTLSLDGVYGVRALFFMPGTYAGTRSLTDLTQYLEDTQNNDDANDLYVTPTSKAQDRDRLYRLP